MAAGRFLSSSVSEDERLNSLSVEAQMMYLMTIPHLDRDGLINGNPSVLHGKVCPLRPKLASRMHLIVEEWVQSGLVVKYANGEGFALWFRGFAKNNPLTHYSREKASRFPAPPGYVRGEKGLTPEVDLPKEEESDLTNETSGESPDISGKMPEESGTSPREVEVEVEVEDQVDQSNAASGDALANKLFDRLAQEWMTVNKTQLDNHRALVDRYGYDAWLAGFDSCKRGQRSTHSYVEKAILSALDRNPSLEKRSPKPKEGFYYTDPVTGVRREVYM